MPYCTIEEAWSQNNFMDKNYLGKDNNGNTHEIVHYSDNIYDDNAQLVNLDGVPKPSNNSRKIPNLSRTYDRLSEHQGPDNRLKNNTKRYIIKNGNKQLDNSNNHPQYSNEDLPLNEYDNLSYQQLMDNTQYYSPGDDSHQVVSTNSPENYNMSNSLEQFGRRRRRRKFR